MSLLSFDPSDRTTVAKAIRHPWLSAYHDEEEEPDCPPPTEKLANIEKLETIDQFREALWNEIEEYRREVRCTNLNLSGVPLRTGSYGPFGSMSRPGSVSMRPTASIGPTASKATDKPEVMVDGARMADLEEVKEHTGSPPPLPHVLVLPEKPEPASEVAEPSLSPAAAPATAATSTSTSTVKVPGPTPRPELVRKDSLQPPSTGDTISDPVMAYSIRSHMYQHQHSATNSPLVYGLPAQTDEPASSVAGLPSSMQMQYSQSVPAGGVPFPSTSASSYILPVRSRTASTTGYSVASEFMPRRLLRTLSTVSIHESMEKIVGGLAGMGPIGALIMDRETGADAPPSEMPREFGFGVDENGVEGPASRPPGAGEKQFPPKEPSGAETPQHIPPSAPDGTGRKKRSTIFSV